MAEKNYSRFSFLQNAELIENRYLGVNNLPRVPKTFSDQLYVIESAYNERPDLLAYQLYNNSQLWWLFAARNPDILKDPIRDFKQGTKIILPAEQFVDDLTRYS